MQVFNLVSLARWIGAFPGWPVAWARGPFQRQALAQRTAWARAERSTLDTTASLADSTRAWQASGVTAAFDLARAQYAVGVQAGLIERSLLASGAFERRLGLLERLTLGPWARRV